MDPSSPLHIDSALLELFRAEVETHMAALGDGLLALEKDSSRVELFEALMRAAHSIKGAARIVGLDSAVEIAHVIEDCFVALRQGRVRLTANTVDALLQGVDLLQRVTQIPDDPAQTPSIDVDTVRRVREAVVECLSGGAATAVPAPALPEAQPAPSPAAAIPSNASPVDTSPATAVRLPQLHEFAVEAREHLAQVCDHLLNLEQAVDDDAQRRVRQLLRAIHSIKGGAGFFGCRTIERVAHLVESVLEAVDRGEVARDAGTVDVLLAGVDRMAALTDDIEHSNESEVTALMTRLETLLGSGESERSVTATSQESQPAPSPDSSASTVAFAPPAASGPARIPAADRGGTLRIPVGLVDRLMTLAGELVLVRNQSRRSVQANTVLPGPVIQRLDTVTAELQETALQTRMQPVANLFGKFPRLVRDLGRQLGKQIALEMVGAEVELDKTILELISDPLTHLVRNSCDHGLEIPADRLRAGKPAEGRITLTARHLGDQICVTVADDGRGIDREAVRRRAIEQGVRTAEEIARLDDKELFAMILLPGFSTASAVTDLSGRGVGMDVVRTNLLQAGGSLDIDSTAGQGTTVTLRLPLTLAIIPCLLVEAAGERYAIPQKDLEELVCVHPGRSQLRIETTTDQEMLRLRGRLLPLVRLAELLRPASPLRTSNIEHRTRNIESREGEALREGEAPAEPRRATAHAARESFNVDRSVLVAIVKTGLRRFGVAVDAVVTSEEIVVKPTHASLRHLPVYSGVTILGDGKVALILNCDGIARHTQVRFGTDAELGAHAVRRQEAERQSLLLFRPGLHEQFAVPLGMIRRIVMVHRDQFEHVGARVFATIDGVATRLFRLEDLLTISSAQDAPIMFVLLPQGRGHPVGFLVHEVLDTVETQVELGPPALEGPGVLGSAMLQGRITSLVDLSQVARACVAGTSEPAVSARKPSGARILLVEDTQFFRELVRDYLVAAGHRVVVAQHGAEGLERLAEQCFDLVISDLEMPVMDGWTFATAVRRRTDSERMPLLALTTLSHDADREKALACGFDAFQVKLDRAEFLARVNGLLARSAAARSADKTDTGGMDRG